MTPLLCIAGFAAAGLLAGAGARLLVGRLRRGARVRPPWCELAVGAAWAATGAALVLGRLPGDWVPALLGLGWLGAALGAVDVARHRLPDALTLPALPVAVLLVAPLGPSAVLRGLGGAGVAVGAHALVRWCLPRAIGGGDVKLAGPLGVVLAAATWAALVPAAVLAAVCTAAVGVAGSWSGRTARGGAVPHGPSMLLAAWLVTTVAAGTG